MMNSDSAVQTGKQVGKTAKKAGKKTAKKAVKKAKRVVTNCIVHISASFNNTVVTITDGQGQVLTQKSSAGCGFRGSRKSTPHAASEAAERAARAAIENYGMKVVDVRVKGPGQGREAAARAIANLGIKVNSVTDDTPVPHNGVKPPKKRRV